MAELKLGRNEKSQSQAGGKRPLRGFILCGKSSLDDAAGNQRIDIGPALPLRD